MKKIIFLTGSHIGSHWFLCGPSIRVELESRNFIFQDERKLIVGRKNPHRKAKPTINLMLLGYNLLGATLTGGKCSHHFAILAPKERSPPHPTLHLNPKLVLMHKFLKLSFLFFFFFSLSFLQCSLQMC